MLLAMVLMPVKEEEEEEEDRVREEERTARKRHEIQIFRGSHSHLEAILRA